MIEQKLFSYTQQLVEELEIDEKIEANLQNIYNFAFSKSLNISIKTIDSAIYVESYLGLLPSQKTEDFLLYMMQANLLGQGTGSGYLGLKEDSQKIKIATFIDEESTYGQFRESIEEFVNWADLWIKKIQDANR